MVAGIAGCAHGDGGHPVSARISGKVEQSGGRYPGIHSPPRWIDVRVTDAARAPVGEESGNRSAFSIVLSKGDYQVSVRDEAGVCGRPQDVAVHSSKSIALGFFCPIK
ncbi:hypothetical protein GCM10027176_38900 [Actinoallomurus bryophytorum]